MVDLLRDFGWAGAGLAGAGDELLAGPRCSGCERLAPEVPLVMLVDRAHHWPMLRRVIGRRLDRRARHQGAARPPRPAAPDLASGRELHVWTVNTPDDLQLCLDLGVKAVITDRPAYVLDLLGVVGSRHGKELSHQGTAPPPPPPRPPARSARASPARAARASATRPATVRPVARRRSSSSRPFEGMPSECDVVALRELVPAATAPLNVKGSDRTVQLCSLLPMAAPAMVRDSGEIWLGLQVQHNFGDPARDLGAVLLKALESEPGIVGLTDQPGEGPRLQDLVTDESLTITVHDGFDYWIADVEDKEGVAAALEQANAAASPDRPADQRRGGVLDERRHQGAPALGDARARGAAARRARAAARGGQGRPRRRARASWACSARTACSPRSGTCPLGTGPEPLEEPADRFAADLREALADTSELTAEQRSARSGLANRQVTLR